MDWTPTFPDADLAPGSMRAHGPLLVVRTADGVLHAMENACPHQGYPLVQGQLAGERLTCCWHNWKFDVRSGACVLGEEGVQTHPVRVRAGVVEVLRRVHVDEAAAWESLAAAMVRRQTARMAREVARLTAVGNTPAELWAWAGAWDTDRAEYGLGHTVALAAEMARWPWPQDARARRQAEVQRVTDVLDLAARGATGLSPRTRPPAESPGADAAVELRRRVEVEDVEGAEALARGLVAAGLGRGAWEAALYPVLGDHFLDFGHANIYLTGVLDLVGLAPAHADAILGGYVRSLAQGTREDVLPPWAGFRVRRDAWVAGGGRDRAVAAFGARPADPQRRDALVGPLADGTPAGAFRALTDALEAGDTASAADGLVLAGATRVWRFDPDIDADATVEEGWLDITHRFTAAVAARHAVAHAPPEAAVDIVIATAHFVRMARALDGPDAPLPDAPPDVEALRARVLAGSRARAIFYAHDVKTLGVAITESARLDHPLPLAAAARYLAAPVRERVIERLAHEAVRLVDDGLPPKTRT